MPFLDAKQECLSGIHNHGSQAGYCAHFKTLYTSWDVLLKKVKGWEGWVFLGYKRQGSSLSDEREGWTLGSQGQCHHLSHLHHRKKQGGRNSTFPFPVEGQMTPSPASLTCPLSAHCYHQAKAVQLQHFPVKSRCWVTHPVPSILHFTSMLLLSAD